jgi:flavin-dependent dehydrogenase
MLDVLVIGGGPVGLAAAIAARRKGLRVALADSRTPPIDKACGEGVMPDGIAAAGRLGLRLPIEDSFAIRGISFEGEGVSVNADFPVGIGRGFRRTVLHTALVEEASQSGADLRWGTTISALPTHEARWIIGADGSGSRVRDWSGLDSFRRQTQRYGFRRHFETAPWSDHIEIHWAEGCQIYVTPVAPCEVGIAVISRDPKCRVDTALRKFPALAERLKGKPETSVERGAIAGSRRLQRVVSGNVALIGDASGAVDAITAEGLCLGFQQALVVAEAIALGDLSLFEFAHKELMRRPQFMADFLLTMDRAAWVRRRALFALASHPVVFARLLAMHVGASRPSTFAASCLELGWHMLLA